jgi:hypothetical protein
MGDTSRPYLIVSVETARGLTLKLTANGERAFENMGLFGGEVINGLPALVSNQVPSGVVIAADAAGIIGDSDTVVLDASRHTSIDMGAPPDSPPSGSTNLISLWPAGQSALRAERYFGFSVARPGAVSALSGVSW